MLALVEPTKPDAYSALQLAPINPQQVLPIRHQPDMTAALPALPHALPMFLDLLIRCSQIGQRPF
jgi:hypothetical protein